MVMDALADSNEPRSTVRMERMKQYCRNLRRRTDDFCDYDKVSKRVERAYHSLRRELFHAESLGDIRLEVESFKESTC